MSTPPAVRFLVPLTARDLSAVLRAASGGKLTLRQSLGRHLARKTRRNLGPLEIETSPRSP